MKTGLNWPIAPGDGQLSPDEVHVWAVSVEGFCARVTELHSLLSEEERQRAARFHFEKDRLRFITARGILRIILASYLNETPQALSFGYGRNGKPDLVQASELKFNLSHADDVVLFALTKNREIGVDVEKVQDYPDIDSVAKRFFLPGEINDLERFSGEGKLKEFYRYWTRGEALLKWSGEGIVEPAERQAITNQFNGTVRELASAPNYAAAVAVTGKSLAFIERQWSPATAIPSSCHK
ncbi:MAG: 4-phosphopantetheinyl transferase, HetI [Verrucomicrobiales bacterium]|nr:4-phosphopantetheinyl transferase, HetI [Verrucomicrobiales bacterium]